MGPPGSSPPTAKVSIHAVPGTALLDTLRGRDSEPEDLGLILPPPLISWLLAKPVCLSFLTCPLGSLMVTASQDCYKGECSDNL